MLIAIGTTKTGQFRRFRISGSLLMKVSYLVSERKLLATLVVNFRKIGPFDLGQKL